eukprot:scaffold2003_cov157-Amphora_coffeaeformis.AAC.11
MFEVCDVLISYTTSHLYFSNISEDDDGATTMQQRRKSISSKHHHRRQSRPREAALSPTVFLLLTQSPRLVECFSPSHFGAQQSSRSAATGTHLSATKATLTDETVWSIRFVLKGVETEKGKKVDEIFRFRANFLEEDGYEPPQGKLNQISSEDDRIKVTSSYWQLSEDPNDRKDGLWVWGLFKEPLYPFLLLKLATDAIPLEGDEDDVIKPLQLFAQINHRRDSELGVVLDASDLKVRQVETIKADPFGAAKVDLYEEVTVGTLSVQPIVAVGK